ncbi:uncharacterized protein ASCRUDRAFT_6141 [Ascoidea rubescens DSM 1968]|uniref:Uncharacterized protein n=1 Tax=Ascoidea rubescens DSM 1968 TaxID=1344418 RepID=A0A1D2VRT7_9ASCO|nr:hypothetical protein ASCRUDRAFT_6141 [Ascoidea rubescens DSM 1968]ODV64298.1 hypothetical protein ASCRUDRAFT_6141 [Ascoidea rubescens DSM 1968]
MLEVSLRLNSNNTRVVGIKSHENDHDRNDLFDEDILNRRRIDCGIIKDVFPLKGIFDKTYRRITDIQNATLNFQTPINHINQITICYNSLFHAIEANLNSFKKLKLYFINKNILPGFSYLNFFSDNTPDDKLCKLEPFFNFSSLRSTLTKYIERFPGNKKRELE